MPTIVGDIEYKGVTASDAIFVIKGFAGNQSSVKLLVNVYANNAQLESDEPCHVFNHTVPYSANVQDFVDYLAQKLSEDLNLTVLP